MGDGLRHHIRIMKLPATIRIERMPEFMYNKSCPYCGFDGFIIQKKSDHQIWRCAKCEKKLLREKVAPKQGLLKRIFDRDR